jgi:hypothetical protein
MAHPVSSRFVPIREALCEVLGAAPALEEVRVVVRDQEQLARLPASQHPALGVFYANGVGAERARWAGNRRDHSYEFEVQVAVRSLESAQACEDLLFAYVEAVEDALRAAPTLGGLVRYMTVTLVRRTRAKVDTNWQAQAALLVTCEQRVP